MKARTEAEWLEKIEADRVRVRALKDDLDNGMNEIEACHKHEFMTRREVEAHAQAVLEAMQPTREEAMRIFGIKS